MSVKNITASTWHTDVVDAGKPVLIDFWADWCPHCRRLAPTIDKVADAYNGKLVVGKVDTDLDGAIAQKYGIEYLPTLVLLAADGTVLGKIIAPADKSAIDEFIAANVELN